MFFTFVYSKANPCLYVQYNTNWVSDELITILINEGVLLMLDS